MTRLGPKAAALLQAGRATHRPSREDQERVEAALRMRLGSRVLPEAPSSQCYRSWSEIPPILS